MIKLFDVANSDFPNYVRYYGEKSPNEIKCSCKWIHHTNDEPYRDLNVAENMLAYGFNVKKKHNKHFLEVSSIKNIPIELDHDGDGLIPIVNINNKRCRINKAFVQTKKGLLNIPGVAFVDVFLQDLTTGEEFIHKIK